MYISVSASSIDIFVSQISDSESVVVTVTVTLQLERELELEVGALSPIRIDRYPYRTGLQSLPRREHAEVQSSDTCGDDGDAVAAASTVTKKVRLT